MDHRISAVQNWYALNSKPRCEKYVQAGLAARGIESYLPLWRVQQPRGQPAMARPFFPSYLFARVDLETKGLSSLIYIPGLRRVVFCGDRPAVVDQAVIDRIRERLAEMEASPADAVGEPLAHGDRVAITGGPFEGFEAVFDRRLSSSQRVRVLIDFLERQVPCEIEPELVRKQASGKFSERASRRFR
jgi:transcriptional antiterminator RfaH